MDLFPQLTVNATQKEECHTPSPIPLFVEEDLIGSIVKRLYKLEYKVNTSQAQPSEMSYKKKDLFNPLSC